MMLAARPILLTIALLAMMPSLCWALADDVAGTVTILKGRATATTAAGDIRVIHKGSELHSSEIVTTASGSYSRLQLRDKTWIMLRPESRFVLEKVEFKKETNEGFGFFSLLKGGFRAVTGLIKKKLNYRYSTAVATIGIRGTSFMVRICDSDCFDIDPPPKNGLYLEVIDHSVVLTNNGGESTFNAGEFAYIANDAAGAEALDGRPDVFVQSPIPVADPADCIQ